MNHAEYQKRVRKMTADELRFVRADAYAAAEAARTLPDGNEVYYMDEVSYCSMELRRRGMM
jgi:hypothetical protein